MNRRIFVRGASGAAFLSLGGCALRRPSEASTRNGTVPRSVAALYGPRPNERFPLPAIDMRQVPSRYWRKRVRFRTSHAPGTVVVQRSSFHLYLVERGGTAMRYGVGLGRAGFDWDGTGDIAWKRAWPTWTPPDSMIAREPHLERWSIRNGGMPPGLTNPLGARALYIFQNGRDTLYRVHGTPNYRSIGRAVSSGCVRMINQDVIDLYRRVKPGSKIIVS